MRQIIWLFACILSVSAIGEFELQSNKVCFGAKGKRSYGKFKVKSTGMIESIQLVHLNGKVNCRSNTWDYSNFGCGKKELSTIITDARNHILFPQKSKINHYGGYHIKGVNSDVKRLFLGNDESSPYVRKGQELRIWYGEALKKKGDRDNQGKSCVEVYIQFIPAKFQLLQKNVCFDAKHDKPGTFSINRSGMLNSIALVHKSGAVSCHWGNGSNWGCYDKLAVVIASSDKKVIFPKPDINGHIIHYYRPQFTAGSKLIVLDNPEYNPLVEKGQKLGLWYGEDLFNLKEWDNKGTVCADVYGSIIPSNLVLQAKNVCFGTKGSMYGKFNVRNGGRLQSIKLKHKSGFVSCLPAHYTSKHSNWGCGGNALTTFITTSQNKVIFPARAKKGSGAYILPGYSSTSKEIVLDNPHRDVEVKLGDELRIWYGEDFFSFADSDNSGKACVDVYADIGQFDLEATNVCFGGKKSAFGSFRLRHSGRVESIKLNYKSGHVTCHSGHHKSTHSKWGCEGKELEVIVTNKENMPVFPGKYSKKGAYTLAGYTSQSKEIILDNPYQNVVVLRGDEFHIWFGEDLLNKGKHNSGEVCVDVYAKIDKTGDYCEMFRCIGQDEGCCTKDKPCGSGEGNCHQDSDCMSGLVCGKKNCPWDDKDNCCVPKGTSLTKKFYAKK